MRLAGIDHRLKLGVGQERAADEIERQARSIARLRRCDRSHRGGLHQLGRVRLAARNADRLEPVFLIDRIAETRAFGRRPVDRLIGEIDRLRVSDRGPGGLRGSGAGEIAAHRPRRGDSRHWDGEARRERQAARDVLRNPTQQGRNVRRNALRFRQSRRVLGGRLVDDDQPCVDRGAVLGVDRAVDRGREHDAAALLQPDEGVAPGRGVRPEARAGDRHQPPAVGETRERRGDMAIGGVGHAPGHVRHRREGRVHQHDARDHGRIEVIVDLGGVEARGGNGRKEGGEHRRPGLGQFVQHERAAGDLGQDGEEAGSGRGLQHTVRGPDGGGGQSHEAEGGWRGKLLEGLALGGAAGVGRE